MDILIAGDSSCLSATLAKAFLRERDEVVLVGSGAEKLKADLPKVKIHSISPSSDLFAEVVAAHRFDMVIYLTDREDDHLYGGSYTSGKTLDGLANTLEMCRKTGIRKVIYISSTEVYGHQETRGEENIPQPVSLSGYALRAGEQYCAYYSHEFGLSPVAIRVPFIYGPGEKQNFLYHTLEALKREETIVFPGDPNAPCGFLHAADIADFVLRLVDAPLTSFQVINLSPADTLTYRELADLLVEHFPHAQFEYTLQKQIYTRPAAVLKAKKNYDWIALHTLAGELPLIAAEVNREVQVKVSFFEQMKAHFPRYPIILKWAELLFGAAWMHYLSGLSDSVVEFRYVDFRLAYVALLGLVYGTRFGLLAAALAGVSLVLNWIQMDLDWLELVYNVSNWLPFAIYLTVGVILGYTHDKAANDQSARDDEVNQLKEKYTFLYHLYEDVTAIKNQFHSQLVGSRDSFGRIFNITRELDSLEEEEVIFNALSVLEDVMDNQTIAIYSLNPVSSSARLQIHSTNLSGQLKKSLDLKKFPDLLETIHSGAIFQNVNLLPGYPSYFVPIFNNDIMTAAVAVWQARFDQNTLYYSNLLRIICGLVQSSINRVAQFMDLSSEKYYIAGTCILQPGPFGKVLKVKEKMQKNKQGSYLLVMIAGENGRNGTDNKAGLFTDISTVIRAEDYVGLREDGNFYILFSQADPSNASVILNRLAQRGLNCVVVNEQKQKPLKWEVDLPLRDSSPCPETYPLEITSVVNAPANDLDVTSWSGGEAMDVNRLDPVYIPRNKGSGETPDTIRRWHNILSKMMNENTPDGSE